MFSILAKMMLASQDLGSAGGEPLLLRIGNLKCYEVPLKPLHDNLTHVLCAVPTEDVADKDMDFTGVEGLLGQRQEDANAANAKG